MSPPRRGEGWGRIPSGESARRRSRRTAKKRDPDRTPEPFGGRPSGGRLFVVQKHAARRLHYDLRLEMDGVLKSWAVPKGPSGHVEEKRLAVHVEDHPVEYGDFEGVIPAGNYGAGAVIVWDHGWYRSAKSDAPLTQLERGTLEVEIFGHKMRGRWTLARMSGRESRDWLLLKKADGAALPPGGVEMTERYPQSVQSGLTVEEMADRAGHIAAVRTRLDARGRRGGRSRRGPSPSRSPRRQKRPSPDPAWLYEIKYDGVRVLAERRGERVALYGRSGQDTTSRYPEIVRALESLRDRPLRDRRRDRGPRRAGRPELPAPAAAHGPDRPAATRPSRRSSAPRWASSSTACSSTIATCVASRCSIARSACGGWCPRWGRCATATTWWARASRSSRPPPRSASRASWPRRRGAAYPAGRTRDWIKIKCQRAQEFVIGGYTDPQGARGYFGALHLGVYDGPPDASRLVYVSKVGTGFDEAGLAAIWERLRPLARATAPFEAGAIPRGRGHHWVEPRLVCEVRFTDWTEDGGLRHPSFVRLLDDTLRGRAGGRAPSPSMRRRRCGAGRGGDAP